MVSHPRMTLSWQLLHLPMEAVLSYLFGEIVNLSGHWQRLPKHWLPAVSKKLTQGRRKVQSTQWPLSRTCLRAIEFHDAGVQKILITIQYYPVQLIIAEILLASLFL